MGELENAIVVLGVGLTHLFEGGQVPTAVYELTLFNLATREELRLPVTNEQAEAVLSLYVPALVAEEEGAEVPGPSPEAAPPGGAPQGRDSVDARVPISTGDIPLSVHQL